MSKTNYLQAVISDLQRTAGPYRCASSGHTEAGANAGYRLFASGFTNSRTDSMNI